MKIKLGDLKRILREEFMLAEKFVGDADTQFGKGINKPKSWKRRRKMKMVPTRLSELDPSNPDYAEQVKAFERGDEDYLSKDIETDFDYYPTSTGAKTLRPKPTDAEISLTGYRRSPDQSLSKMRSELGNLSRDILEPLEDEIRNALPSSSLGSSKGPSKRSLLDLSIRELQEIQQELRDDGEDRIADRVQSAISRILGINMGF